jgi:hypothetical protein
MIRITICGISRASCFRDQSITRVPHVQNIIDWGKDKHPKEIRDSMDSLLEERRRRTSEAAKSRPPPSDDPTSSRSLKRRCLFPRGRNSRAEEPPSRRTDAPPSERFREMTRMTYLSVCSAFSLFSGIRWSRGGEEWIMTLSCKRLAGNIRAGV